MVKSRTAELARAKQTGEDKKLGADNAQGADVGTLNLEVGYGYFLTQGWELGVQQ